MPKIPGFQEQQRVAQGSPINLVDPGAARREGTAVSQLGRSMENFSRALAAADQAKDKLFRLQMDSAAKNAAQEAYLYALTNDQGAPDGSSVRSDFASKYKEALSPILEGLPKERRSLAESIFNQVGVDQRGALVPAELKMRNEYFGTVANDAYEQLVFQTENNPEGFLDHFEDFQKTVDALPWHESQKKEFVKKNMDGLPKSAINGFLKRNEYKKAYEVLESEMSQFLSEDERAAQLSKIEQTKRTRLNHELQYESALYQRNQRLVKEKQEKNFHSMMQQFSGKNREQLMEPGPTGKSFFDQVHDAFTSNQISWEQRQAFMNANTRVPPSLDDASYGTLIHDIYVGQDSIATKRARIVKAMSNNSLSGQKGAQLLGILEKEATVRKSLDPITNKNLTDYKKGLLKIIGGGAKRDFFGNPILNPRQEALLTEFSVELNEAAGRGRSALSRKYDELIRRLPEGDSYLRSVPRGVDPKSIDSRSKVENNYKLLGQDLARMSKEGKKGTEEFKRKRRLFFYFRDLHLSNERIKEEKQKNREALQEMKEESSDRGDGFKRRK